jgi:GxxExxY protein
MDIEEIGRIAVDCGMSLHRQLGPGMLETAYETIMAHLLESRGLSVVRQRMIPITFEGLEIEQGFRADIVIENKVLLELKSVPQSSPVHKKQVLTYLRFLDLRLGYLMNFGCETFVEGLQRIVNNHTATGSSQLRIHQ